MSSAFALHVEPDGLATLAFDLPGASANIFTREVMEELAERIEELAGRDDVRCLVLLSGKPRIFIAGADIDGIAEVTDGNEAEEAARQGQRLFGRWSKLPFPTIAAVRGTCVGGGTELALASSFILLSDRADIRIGLPETKLGILPGWGGCARLPRRIGLAAALDVILGGKTLRPKKALKLGLVDALLPDAAFGREVRRFAQRVMAGEKRRPRRRAAREKLLEGNPLGRRLVFDQARKQVLKRTAGHYPAPLRAIEVVRAGVEGGLEKGLDAEARAIGELAVSPVCKNLVHLFKLMEGAKTDGFVEGGDPLPVEAGAVLGAGVMGGGIAQLLADKGLPVRLKDIGEDALAKGVAHAAGLWKKRVRRRWLTRPEAERRLALIRPTLDHAGFGGVDLVVEAVVEKLEVKRVVFAELARHVRPETILASNTSSLSIDSIAEATPGPERVVGMHFFNPVDKMPLVEVVVGEKTSPAAANTVVALCRRLGKTPVVVKNGPGFLVNRLLAFTLAEAMWLLDEGWAIPDLDRLIKGWGLPMGPCALTDEVGIDVGVEVSRVLGAAYPERLTYPDWMDRLSEGGRLGAKAGKGFYKYAKGKRTEPDPEVYDLLGIRPGPQRGDTGGAAERVVLPMVNEAARCLKEGIVHGAGELDLAMILGTGFPPFRGGLCRWADGQGPERLADRMRQWASRLGERFAPSSAYERVVEAGGFYALYG